MKNVLPPNWSVLATDNQKNYRRLLEKGNRKKMLHLLPQLHEEAFETIDCLTCANCCKNFSPRFKQPDIKRIAKKLKLKEGDFIERFLRLDEDNDFVVKTTPCPFLGSDNYCSIYEDRPSDCSRYPYTDEDVLLKRTQLTLKNATVCPAVFLVLERLNESV
jgi:hypothetical protein